MDAVTNNAVFSDFYTIWEATLSKYVLLYAFRPLPGISRQILSK